MAFNINEFLCSPWAATHIVKQQGNGVLTPVDNPELVILPINKVDIIKGTNLSYPFKVNVGDKGVVISMTEKGREWCAAAKSGWWCVRLKNIVDFDAVVQALTKVKPATPVGVVKKAKAKKGARPAEFDEFKIGQKVQVGSDSVLRNHSNRFGNVYDDAGKIGEVVEILAGRQGIRIEVNRAAEGKSPSRYVYEARHLLLFTSKKKKAKDLPPVERLIAKRLAKLSVGDSVLVLSDACAKLPGRTSMWTDAMFERIGYVYPVESIREGVGLVEVDGYLFHVLDLAKV